MTPSSQLQPSFSRWHLFAGLAVVGCVVALFLFNPSDNGFYPQCTLKRLTGLSCPGCGALRATHQLLHGHVKTAFSLNPLYVLILPYLLFILGQQLFSSVTGRKGIDFVMPQMALWLFVGVLCVFAVLRNLPGFSWLGP